MYDRNRKYVIPGDLITEGRYRASYNVVKVNEQFYSTRVGLSEVGRDGVRVIPLSGIYIPRVDDIVIGKVIDYSTFGWDVDINSCFVGFLHAQNIFGKNYSPGEDSLSSRLDKGDLISTRVNSFDRTRNPLLSVAEHGLGKLDRGETIKISPTKVPRVIGKKGTMIKSIEFGTGSKLSVGQNGLVVVIGPPESVDKATRAIKMVEDDAHLPDLTEKIQQFLENN